MRLIALFIIFLTVSLTGCDKLETETKFSASYQGTFVRNSNKQVSAPLLSPVVLQFTEKTFNGTSNIKNYPAICSGDFTINQSTLTIKNNCVFTADFDWTLIFQGVYNYELKGEQLHIWRTYADGSTDDYRLTKEN